MQLIPHLAPPVTGVGDYALQLAGELRQSYGIGTRFVVGDPTWRGPAEVDGFPVSMVAAQTSRHLAALLASEAADRLPVLLHYVGYGYEKRGCPIWLVRGLKQWRRGSSHRRLLTMFHELYATGSIWSSSFWMSPLQRRLAAKLADISHRCRTNMRAYANWLERQVPRHRGQIRVFPVFSTIGEPATIRPLPDRPPWLVIFGGGKWLDESASKHRAAIDRVCDLLQVEKIVTIGPPSYRKIEFSRPVEEHGVLPAPMVSHWLAAARIGFVDYGSGYLGKSSIFAAYCAHGVAPLLPAVNASEADGVFAGRHYIVSDDLDRPTTENCLQTIANNAQAWYSGHSLERTVAVLAKDVELFSANSPLTAR